MATGASDEDAHPELLEVMQLPLGWSPSPATEALVRVMRAIIQLKKTFHAHLSLTMKHHALCHRFLGTVLEPVGRDGATRLHAGI